MPQKSVFWGTLQPQLPHLQPDLPSFLGLGQTFVSEKRVFYLLLYNWFYINVDGSDEASCLNEKL
ncbi:hypothetical protein [Runella sp. SP2]|uniref:hypothetical protein n=1 Tax=Runella sp. SP2 TaxID=2268026 RepID=UPI000F08E696|nr:hypothetical protein [Runella sp. SP2]AYQ33258.1 hypothetical protein DTQ70_14300 [Runella sp. SP2]